MTADILNLFRSLGTSRRQLWQGKYAAGNTGIYRHLTNKDVELKCALKQFLNSKWHLYSVHGAIASELDLNRYVHVHVIVRVRVEVQGQRQ